jgi:hypothetical protein
MTAEPVLTTDLARGEQVHYRNTDSKQTSRCGAAPDAGVKPLCWVEVTVSRGKKNYTGFVPAARGLEAGKGFTDAFCAADTPREALLVEPCGKQTSIALMLTLVLDDYSRFQPFTV